jgi:hypothetical protein
MSKSDYTQFEANWIIEGDKKIVVPKTEANSEVIKTESFKKLRFNCTYHKQDATSLYFKIDFLDPLWVSQSVFGKD